MLSTMLNKRKASVLNCGDDHTFMKIEPTSAEAADPAIIKISKLAKVDPLFSSFPKSQQNHPISADQIELLYSLSLTQTHQNNEYTSFDAVANPLTSFLNAIPFLGKPLASAVSHLVGATPNYSVEIISPANEWQIARNTPHPPSMVRETPALYRSVVEPFIAKKATDKSLGWVYSCVDGSKEKERLLLDEPGFILNVDTKWKSHANCLKVDKNSWMDHADTNLNDLYCLAIFKERGVRTLRDLNGGHIALLKLILEQGKAAIQETYGVEGDQLKIFIHYIPQFYHLHVHFTRLWNDNGCQVERAHLLEDVIQNLESDAEYYEKRTISYKLASNDALFKEIEQAE